MDSIAPKHQSETNATPGQVSEAYNLFLYHHRQKAKVSRRRYAKHLGISYFRYCLIENGYILPSRKETAKISNCFGLDFEAYLQGESSYPGELPEKSRNRITGWFYHLLSALWLRITLGVLAVGATSLCLVGIYQINRIQNQAATFFDPGYIAYTTALREQGSPTPSLITEWGAPQISENLTEGDAKTSRIIVGTNNVNNPAHVAYQTFVWTDAYRLSFSLLTEDPDKSTYHCSVGDYVEGDVYSGFASKEQGKVKVVLYTANGDLIDISTYPKKERAEELMKLGEDYLNAHNLEQEWVGLINDKLGLSYNSFYEDIYRPKEEGQHRLSEANAVWLPIVFFTFFIGLFSIFGFAYAMIYGEHHHQRIQFGHSDALLELPCRDKPMKKNHRFTPFLPETVLEIIGIVLVALGAARVLLYVDVVISPGSYSTETFSVIPNFLLSLYFLGMVLLYFLDFDLFFDDTRLLRNLVLYPLLFIGLYAIEVMVMTGLESSQSLAVSTVYSLSHSLIPNNFMSVTCYFLTMFFLFFTPKRIKSKRSLIIFRCLSLIPFLYTFASFFIGNGDYFFGWQMSVPFHLFFKVERMPVSIICFSYLFGLFFLRLFFKVRYGEEKANRFFLGNRFLFIKNIMISLIVIAVWAFEVSLRNDASLNKLGLGVNIWLIVLVPLLLFYHPHKGPRVKVVDYTTIGLYGIAMIWSYVLAAILLIASGVWLGLLV